MVEHERIWLEPSPGADEDYGRQWCQHNVWGDEATEYVLATSVSGFPVELLGVAEELAEGSGAWLACSGCHELNEGHPTGPWSDILKSHIGLGCRECGGIGSVWDNTDYRDISALDNNSIDDLAYRFWSIHPSELDDWVKTAPQMPHGYRGGARAWFYACQMRSLIASEPEETA